MSTQPNPVPAPTARHSIADLLAAVAEQLPPDDPAKCAQTLAGMTTPAGRAAPYRVLVTGSRDWKAVATVRRALNAVLADVPAPRPIVVVHGDCPTGADIMAKVWATTWCGQERVTHEPVEAAWHLHGDAAGPRRNALMVARGADVCLAFIGPCASPKCRRLRPHGSHGATHCADLAEAAGIPVRRWTA